mmetsp:Transcript_19827/g.60144  ORF Transcript_19827/g.60144 Transcript_19827/m.60144 type:complete len:91 (+) Transcript_19827:429-701(+)
MTCSPSHLLSSDKILEELGARAAVASLYTLLFQLDELVDHKRNGHPPDESITHSPRGVLVPNVEVLLVLHPLLDRGGKVRQWLEAHAEKT